MTFEQALAAAGGIGIIIAMILALLFGVLDIQCSDNPAGRYWNAELQQCQAREVQS